MPLSQTRKLQMIAVSDIASFARSVMERPSEFEGRRVELASDELTAPQIASVLSHATRSPITFAPERLADVRAEDEGYARMWEWLDRVGFDTDIEALQREYPDVGWHTLVAWAREQNYSSLDVAAAEQPTA